MRGWVFGLVLTVAAAAQPGFAETEFAGPERCAKMPPGFGPEDGEEPWRTMLAWRGSYGCDSGPVIAMPDVIIQVAFRQSQSAAITMFSIPRRQLPVQIYDVYGQPLLLATRGESFRFGGDYLLGADGGLVAELSSRSTISVRIRTERGWAEAKRRLFEGPQGSEALFKKTDDARDALQRYVSRIPLPIDHSSMLAGDLATVGLVVGDCNSFRWKIEPGPDESGPDAICRLEWQVSGDLVGRVDFRSADLEGWKNLIHVSDAMLKGWIAGGSRE